MKISENRKTLEPPPIESYTLIVSPEELKLLHRFADYYANNVEWTRTAPHTVAAAVRFYSKLNIHNVSWSPETCFLDN